MNKSAAELARKAADDVSKAGNIMRDEQKLKQNFPVYFL